MAPILYGEESDFFDWGRLNQEITTRIILAKRIFLIGFQGGSSNPNP